MLTAMTDKRAAYCILAVENETKINYAMPVKNGLYDFLQFAKQVTEIDEFFTNFREIMKYIKYSLNGKKLKETVSSDERFKSIERQAVDVINVVTGSKVKYPEGEEAVDMCLAIQEIKEEGKSEGRLPRKKPKNY